MSSPQAMAPDRNYPALFLALDDVLLAIDEGKAQDGALQASFAWATEGFGAQRAVLLALEGKPARRRALAHKGLADYEVIACEAGSSVPGVSTSCITEVLEKAQIVLLQDTSHLTGGLASGAFGGAYSVLCAPIADPRTGRILAVLYLQNDGVKDAFGEIDRAWIEVYAKALGRAMGGPRSHRAGRPADENES
jgi:hypothetical protein